MVYLVFLVYLELQGQTELQVSQVRQEKVEQLVHLVSQVRQEKVEQLVHLVSQVRQEKVEQLVLQALQEQMVLVV
jgi:hypothetical protein